MDTQKYIIEKYNVSNKKQEYQLLNIFRKDLIVLFKELGFIEGCEVGVFRGRFSRFMLDTIPNLKLHCVDCWKPVGHRSEQGQKRYFAKTKNRLRKYRKNDQVHLIKKWSMDAVRKFENESLDFVFIDANHNFDHVMQDIIEWSKKVRIGGIVSGHDYTQRRRERGVVLAVNAYVKAHRIKPWFLTNGDTEKSWLNSWFWVKNK